MRYPATIVSSVTASQESSIAESKALALIPSTSLGGVMSIASAYTIGVADIKVAKPTIETKIEIIFLFFINKSFLKNKFLNDLNINQVIISQKSSICPIKLLRYL